MVRQFGIVPAGACAWKAPVTRMAIAALAFCMSTSPLQAEPLLVVGDKLYTSSDAGVIEFGGVLIEDGKITAAGALIALELELGTPVLRAPVVIPGLVDNRTLVAAPLAIETDGENAVARTRSLMGVVVTAVGDGMAPEQAVLAATIEPARLWGVDDRVGSLEIGKDANLVLLSGEPFEDTTLIENVLVNGEVVADEPQ